MDFTPAPYLSITVVGLRPVVASVRAYYVLRSSDEREAAAAEAAQERLRDGNGSCGGDGGIGGVAPGPVHLGGSLGSIGGACRGCEARFFGEMPGRFHLAMIPLRKG